jgi:WLM domain
MTCSVLTAISGLNVNGGEKIYLRLREPFDERQFLPQEAVLETMLHELTHIVRGPHDATFFKILETLKREQESLMMKGYTGEGFLSTGRQLGGNRIPLHEARRIARERAEKRRAQNKGSGQKLGGDPTHRRPGKNARDTIADAIERRLASQKAGQRGCGTGATGTAAVETDKAAEQASKNGFRTKAEEDNANELAIMSALMELHQEEEKEKWGDAYQAPSQEDPAPNSQVDEVSEAAGITNGMSEEEALERAIAQSRDDFEAQEKQARYRQELAKRQSKISEGQSEITPKEPSAGPRKKGQEKQEPGWKQVKEAQRQKEKERLGSRDVPIDLPDSPPSKKIARDRPARPGKPMSRLVRRSSDDVAPPPPVPMGSKPLYPADPSQTRQEKLPFQPAQISQAAQIRAALARQAPQAQASSHKGDSETWDCPQCTLKNSNQFLMCEACYTERPPRTKTTLVKGSINGAGIREVTSKEWKCNWCGTHMDSMFWTCEGCGKMKESS